MNQHANPPLRGPKGERANRGSARCIKKIYELGPLECPKCKSKMPTLFILHDAPEIKKIMKSQGIPDYTAPPPIPDFSRQSEILDEIHDYRSVTKCR